MMRVFLDTNILMDVAEFRRYSTEAKNILELCRHGAFETFAATMSFATMSYLLRHQPRERVHALFEQLTNVVNVVSVTTEQFERAMAVGVVRDFEDLMQYQSAVDAGCDVIITNNGEDFLEFSQLPVVSSRDFLLNYYRQQEGK